MDPTFAIVGAGGYIAPKHVAAIHALGGQLVAAVDPSTTVGYLDRFFPKCLYYQSVEELVGVEFDYLVVCTPNYLHMAHCLLGQRLAKRGVICEKPLALDSAQLTPLCKGDVPVYTILQLRYHPGALALKGCLGDGPYNVKLNYTAIRGDWYWKSWKGIEAQSGGILFNIGIHLFDLLIWLFGPVVEVKLHTNTLCWASGLLRFATANVDWVLGIKDHGDAVRELRLHGPDVDPSFGSELVIDFSNGFTDLHQKCYEAILDPEGQRVGVGEARETIDLVELIMGL